MIRRLGSNPSLPSTPRTSGEQQTRPLTTVTPSASTSTQRRSIDTFDAPQMRAHVATSGQVQLPAARTERALKLANIITEAATAYKEGDYETAYNLLASTKKGVLKVTSSMKMITPDMSIDTVLSLARNKAFSSITKPEITLLDFMLAPQDGGFVGQPFYEDPELAKRLLPIMLEEWMHQFQNENQGLISPRTHRFANAAAQAGLPSFDESTLREVDILATFHDWGFPVKKLGTVSQYPERGLFEAWHQAGEHWNIRGRHL